MEFYKYENTIEALKKYFEGGNAKNADPTMIEQSMKIIIEIVSSIDKR